MLIAACVVTVYELSGRKFSRCGALVSYSPAYPLQHGDAVLIKIPRQLDRLLLHLLQLAVDHIIAELDRGVLVRGVGEGVAGAPGQRGRHRGQVGTEWRRYSRLNISSAYIYRTLIAIHNCDKKEEKK